jgi:hypothetical protein
MVSDAAGAVVNNIPHAGDSNAAKPVSITTLFCLLASAMLPAGPMESWSMNTWQAASRYYSQ